MTPISNTAEAPTTLTVAEVKKMLRDLGYALKMSRQLSAEILAERESKKAAFVRASEGVSGGTQVPDSIGGIRLHS